MRRLYILMLTITIGLLVGACSRSSQVVDLPTFVPSITPTLIPTATDTPTITRTPTPTPTLTPTRTFTPTPTLTFTPSITPTSTLTWTPSNTPTSTPTPTYTPSPTPPVPTIYTFEAVQDPVLRGGAVTLRWDVDADSVIIEVLDKQTRVLNTIPVPPRGEEDFQVPRRVQDLVIFSMTARRGDATDTLDVPVSVICGVEWFFDDERVDNEGCPATGQASGIGRYQTFENGYMVYIPTQGRVYVLYDGEQSGAWVYHGLRGGNALAEDQPDEGRFAPQNEFVPIWEDTNAPNNDDWEDVIGWGILPAVQTNITIQQEQDSPAFYVGTGDGRLFRLIVSPQQSNRGTWQRLD